MRRRLMALDYSEHRLAVWSALTDATFHQPKWKIFKLQDRTYLCAQKAADKC